jgi:hypothetical protein
LNAERTVGHIYPAATGADPKIPRFKPAFFPVHSRDAIFMLFICISAVERGLTPSKGDGTTT